MTDQTGGYRGPDDSKHWENSTGAGIYLAGIDPFLFASMATMTVLATDLVVRLEIHADGNQTAKQSSKRHRGNSKHSIRIDDGVFMFGPRAGGHRYSLIGRIPLLSARLSCCR